MFILLSNMRKELWFFYISIFGDICCRCISTIRAASGSVRDSSHVQRHQSGNSGMSLFVTFSFLSHFLCLQNHFFCHIFFLFKVSLFVTFSFSSKSLFCHIFPFFKVSWTIFSFCLLGHIFFFFKIDKCVNLLPRYITKKGYNMTVIMKRIR